MKVIKARFNGREAFGRQGEIQMEKERENNRIGKEKLNSHMYVLE